jgi:hypothetical protein
MKLVHFVWRNLDAFLAMQDHLDRLPPSQRPAYNEISSRKAKDRYPDAFTNADDLVKSMKEAKSKKVGSAGLWPLDVHSYNDWRSTSHVKKVYSEYIIMARIEISIIKTYRSSLFQQCPAAAFIRQGVASLLNDVCTLSAWAVFNPATKNHERRQVRRFRYADKVPCNSPSAQQPPSVDVLDLRLKRQRATRSKALATDAVAILKKIEGLRASAATPRGKELDPSVAKAVKMLKHVRAISVELVSMFLITPGIPD